LTEPKRIDGPNPHFPEQARQEGINGVVVMECVIAEDGSVRNVEVVQSNADILSVAAVEAVEQWTFEPATLDGLPVAIRYTLTVRFNLK
jgi:protein TonB